MLTRALQFLLPKIFFAAATAAVLWIGIATRKEMQRGERIQEEIASLQSEARKTKKENDALYEKIRYFQTDDFQEKEARGKLNYQRPDEKVVVIAPAVASTDTVKQEPSSFAPEVKAQSLLPNYEKWWNRFSR